MVVALNLAQAMSFLGIFGLMFLGIFVIALITPKLANWIDKKRAENKSPYEAFEPRPERVEDTALQESNDTENSTNF